MIKIQKQKSLLSLFTVSKRFGIYLKIYLDISI